MNLSGLVATSLASLAGLGLIGTGAQAICAHPGRGGQTTSPGAPSVVLSSPATPGCTRVADHCSSLALPSGGPVGSRFDTAPIPVTITNTGNLAVTEASVQLTATSPSGEPASNYLRDEMNVCISNGSAVVANGPLDRGLALSPSVALAGPAMSANGGTYEYAVDFYAGENSLLCRADWSDNPRTASAWSGAAYPGINPWSTPASLTRAAEGGAVTITVTISYTSTGNPPPTSWGPGHKPRGPRFQQPSSPAPSRPHAPVVGSKGTSNGPTPVPVHEPLRAPATCGRPSTGAAPGAKQVAC